MRHMTEADENTLRVLAARLRDERPDDLIALLFDVLLFKFPAEAMAGIGRKDGDGIPDAMLVVFTGARPAEWARKALEELKQRLENAKREAGETGAG